jgi:hypothetical protein
MRAFSAVDPATPAKFGPGGKSGIAGRGGAAGCDQPLVALPSTSAIASADVLSLPDLTTRLPLQRNWRDAILGQ